MSEIRDIARTKIRMVILRYIRSHPSCKEVPIEQCVDLQGASEQISSNIPELAVVNREAKPNVEWTATDDVSIATQIKIGEAFSKAYAGWVKEE